MPPIKEAALAYQLKRWMRPDAHLFIRPDWRKFVRPGFEDGHPFALYEKKYRPDQLRDDHGRWAEEGGAGGTGEGIADADTEVPPTADVNEILEMARRIAARGYSTGYLKCLEICYPLLERMQPPGADFNESAFRKCMNACLGRN